MKKLNISLKDMQRNIVILSDQPTTCGKCGTRTEFDDPPNGQQHHRCPSCNHEFIAEDGDEPIGSAGFGRS